ncbi:MAG: hypothetical protein ABEJ87_05815 [Candidatus Nanohalobium sp.]
MLFFSRYEAFESDSEDGDLPEDFLDRFEGEMLGSDRLLSLLTAIGVKPAADVEGFFDSQESFEDFISVMNSAGLNCYVEFDPSDTEAESMTSLFDEEDADVSLTEGFEVKARIFLTRREYGVNFFRKMKLFRKTYRSRYHRMYGEFLGFREEDIEAFIEDQREEVGPESDSRRALRPEELAEKFGDELSEEEMKAFEALHFGLMENSEKRFRQGVKEMRERKEKLEESSFDAEKVVEERSFQ